MGWNRRLIDDLFLVGYSYPLYSNKSRVRVRVLDSGSFGYAGPPEVRRRALALTSPILSCNVGRYVDSHRRHCPA